MMKNLQGDMQDGMLAHYLSQVRASDVNVEARLDREPFNYRDYLQRTEEAYNTTKTSLVWIIKCPPKI